MRKTEVKWSEWEMSVFKSMGNRTLGGPDNVWEERIKLDFKQESMWWTGWTHLRILIIREPLCQLSGSKRHIREKLALLLGFRTQVSCVECQRTNPKCGSKFSLSLLAGICILNKWTKIRSFIASIVIYIQWKLWSRVRYFTIIYVTMFVQLYHWIIIFSLINLRMFKDGYRKQ